jgi:hypothetical protein
VIASFYRSLLDREKALADKIPAAARDAYVGTVGFPARVLGAVGLIFMAYLSAQREVDAAANEAENFLWKKAHRVPGCLRVGGASMEHPETTSACRTDARKPLLSETKDEGRRSKWA